MRPTQQAHDVIYIIHLGNIDLGDHPKILLRSKVGGGVAGLGVLSTFSDWGRHLSSPIQPETH